jgi:hypothetical protein
MLDELRFISGIHVWWQAGTIDEVSRLFVLAMYKSSKRKQKLPSKLPSRSYVYQDENGSVLFKGFAGTSSLCMQQASQVKLANRSFSGGGETVSPANHRRRCSFTTGQLRFIQDKACKDSLPCTVIECSQGALSF